MKIFEIRNDRTGLIVRACVVGLIVVFSLVQPPTNFLERVWGLILGIIVALMIVSMVKIMAGFKWLRIACSAATIQRQNLGVVLGIAGVVLWLLVPQVSILVPLIIIHLWFVFAGWVLYTRNAF